jgi:hypothetical protein
MKLKSLFLASTVVFFTGCNNSSDSPIETVKNGVMQFNKSLTVGEAFDNYESCDSSQWNELQQPNGQLIVEFKCEITTVEPFIARTISTLEDVDSSQRFLQLHSLTNTYQWQINKDNSFEISNIDSVWQWKDGKKFSVYVPKNEYIQNLKTVYENKATFDLNLYDQADPALNHAIAMSFYEIFIEFYNAAN